MPSEAHAEDDLHVFVREAVALCPEQPEHLKHAHRHTIRLSSIQASSQWLRTGCSTADLQRSCQNNTDGMLAPPTCHAHLFQVRHGRHLRHHTLTGSENEHGANGKNTDICTRFPPALTLLLASSTNLARSTVNAE